VKKERILISVLVPIVLLLAAVAGLAHAQGPEPPELGAPQVALGTAFTYQGQLKVDGEPVDDECWFAFRLYDDLAAVDSVATPFTTTTPILITDGLFTVDVEFGDGAFTGDARWLGIQVKCGSEESYTPLGRQALTAIPYALYASDAGDADLLGGLPAGAFWTTGGNAGTDPTTHFVGTTDAVSLTLAVGGTTALRLVPAAGTPNIIGGYSGNSVTPGVVGATVGGGGTSANINRATGNYGTVSGGYNNQAGDDDGDPATSRYATVGGGTSNTANSNYATIAGGRGNVITGTAGSAAIGGGRGNTITATAVYATIPGGQGNTASAGWATVGGGHHNTASEVAATVGGGNENTASADAATVGGGSENSASASSTTVGGGMNNSASAGWATVGGGYSNTANRNYATIAGGRANVISGTAGSATIGGGRGNTITATATFATVPGGFQAEASHYGEMAYASGCFAVRGDAQTSVYVLRRTSTGSSQTQLFLDPSSNQQITLPVSRTVTFDILVVAAAENGQAASYQYAGGIKHTASGGTALIGPIQPLMELEDDSAWSVLIDADTGNNALRIRVTGAAGRTIRWVATVRTVETVMP
jgi:hypothetical protein